MALARSRVPISVFGIEHRRGKFALVKDLAIWLARQRFGEPSIPSEQTRRNVTMT